jgi:hypothetical protein
MARVTAKISWQQIQRKISRSRKLNQALERTGRMKFNKMKKNLMKNFDNHLVTQEILGGSTASNVTDSLGGYGNLFSFVGFTEGSSPTSEVRTFLESSVRLKISKRNETKKRLIGKKINIKLPTIKEFAPVGRMPYEGGNSWIEMIERGMSNFSRYMHKKTTASRSGAGIQVKGRIRSAKSKPTQYMTELLEKFKKELRTK